MRVVRSDLDGAYYENVFKHLKTHATSFVVWQLSPETGKRVIAYSHIQSFSLKKNIIQIELDSLSALDQSRPLLCYAPDGPIIFKTQIHEFHQRSMELELPAEMKLLEDDELSELKMAIGINISDEWHYRQIDFGSIIYHSDNSNVILPNQRSSRDRDFLQGEMGLTLDEEDKLFAGTRESPRARPKDDKWVTLTLAEGGEVLRFKLFDLSRGGLSFITFGADLFPKGEKIQVLGFNDYQLDDPLIAEVMSNRPMDGLSEETKVGVKFSEGLS
jgi:hypothetical protein